MENDFWDLEEQQLSLTNMEAELGRLKSGQKINLLNVGFEDLLRLFTGLELASGGLETKINKMRDEILDAIHQQSVPFPTLQPPSYPYSSYPTVGSGTVGSGTPFYPGALAVKEAE